jgi:hypothetical protein
MCLPIDVLERNPHHHVTDPEHEVHARAQQQDLALDPRSAMTRDTVPVARTASSSRLIEVRSVREQRPETLCARSASRHAAHRHGSRAGWQLGGHAGPGG